jgi:hypothetical protein
VASAGVRVLSDNERPNALGRGDKSPKNVFGQRCHQGLLRRALIKTLADGVENLEAFITD